MSFACFCGENSIHYCGTVDTENVRTRRLKKNAQKRTDAKYLNDYLVAKRVEKSGKSLINADKKLQIFDRLSGKTVISDNIPNVAHWQKLELQKRCINVKKD